MMEQPVHLPEVLLLTLYSACGLYFLQSDIQWPAALFCATGAMMMAALLLHHTMQNTRRTRRSSTEGRRRSDPDDGVRRYVQVERDLQQRRRDSRYNSLERRSDRTIRSLSPSKPRLVVTNEEFINALRSQELSADIHYRRCKEEKKWALSQGNKARAFQLSSQIKRYAELKENFRKEIEYQSSRGSETSHSRTIDISSHQNVSSGLTSTRNNSRSTSTSSDATIRPRQSEYSSRTRNTK